MTSGALQKNIYFIFNTFLKSLESLCGSEQHFAAPFKSYLIESMKYNNCLCSEYTQYL